jgi:hypothetical protein
VGEWVCACVWSSLSVWVGGWVGGRVGGWAGVVSVYAVCMLTHAVASSAYVSIRQHTSAYVSIRHAVASSHTTAQTVSISAA